MYFGDCDYDETPLHAVQWTATDRCEVQDLLMSVTDFIALIGKKIESYIPHYYSCKSQSGYMTHKKETMTENEAIILMDFSANSPFKVQNSAQRFHWNNHPVLIHHRENSVLLHQSMCFISDNLMHDVTVVYQVFDIHFQSSCRRTNMILFFQVQKVTMNFINKKIQK
jgi:hypothetical protein